MFENNAPWSLEEVASPGERGRLIASWLMLALAIIVSMVALSTSWNQPVVDMHGFRQTQTAYSAWAMEHEGALLAYETPVLGHPWTMPFEFPSYQWLVVALSSTGLGLENAGRAVSVIAMLLLAWPVSRLAGRMSRDRSFVWTLTALVLSAPVVVFWGRSFMIETTALLFAMLWLMFALDYLERPRALSLVAGLAFGCLAAATKITTYAPTFGLGLLVVLALGLSLRLLHPRFWKRWLGLAALFALPILAGLGWTAYTDELKLATPLARNLTSEALRAWNLGTWEHRSASWLYADALVNRPLAVLGPLAYLLPLAILAAARRSLPVALFCVFLGCVYLGGFLVFPRLYTVHDYYHLAVAPLLTASFVIALWWATEPHQKAWFIVAAAALQLSQLGYLGHHYWSRMTTPGWDNTMVRVGLAIRGFTAPGDGVLVVGTGYNSTIPFYSSRRSVGLPEWVSASETARLTSDPQSFFGDVNLTLAVKCGYQFDLYQDVQRAELQRFFDGLPEIEGARVGPCSFHRIDHGAAADADPPRDGSEDAQRTPQD